MKYLGGLGDLYGTVTGAAKALENLNSISGHLAGVVMQRRMQRMGALNVTNVTSQDPSFGAPTVGTVTTSSNGNTVTTYTNGTVSTFNPINGNTTSVNSAGQPQIFNSAGQDITANYTTYPQWTTASAISTSVSDAITNLPKTIASTTTPIITIAVIGIVAYFLLRNDR